MDKESTSSLKNHTRMLIHRPLILVLKNHMNAHPLKQTFMIFMLFHSRFLLLKNNFMWTWNSGEF